MDECFSCLLLEERKILIHLKASVDCCTNFQRKSWTKPHFISFKKKWTVSKGHHCYSNTLCCTVTGTQKENDIYQIDVELHKWTWNHRTILWYPNAHLCAGNRLIPGTQESQELAPFGDDQISRTQKDYCKTVKDVQEIEVQLSATNPKVYNFGTGQMDKWDNHTNNLGQPFFHCFTESIYVPHVCSNIIMSKLSLTTVPFRQLSTPLSCFICLQSMNRHQIYYLYICLLTVSIS